jgi:hypothetical protein
VIARIRFVESYGLATPRPDSNLERQGDPDEAAVRELQGGADDKMFRLDRTGLSECAALAYDRKELAAMRHK